MARPTEARLERDGPLRVTVQGTNGVDVTFTVVPEARKPPFLIVDVGDADRTVVDDVTATALAKWLAVTLLGKELGVDLVLAWDGESQGRLEV